MPSFDKGPLDIGVRADLIGGICGVFDSSSGSRVAGLVRTDFLDFKGLLLAISEGLFFTFFIKAGDLPSFEAGLLSSIPADGFRAYADAFLS